MQTIIQEHRNVKDMCYALVFLCFCAAVSAQDGPRERFGQFESGVTFTVANDIDALVMPTWRQQGIEPANLCSDAVFIRRVYLDVIGTLPEPQAVREFLKDTQPDKRATLIDALLKRDEFADYWSLKWCDLLRVKAEFPINL